MRSEHSGLRLSVNLLSLMLCVAAVCEGQAQNPRQKSGGDFSTELNPSTKVPSGVILVKGAWSSASDSTTPLPEGGQVTGQAYENPYFRLSYPLPRRWKKGNDGPPPSDRGYYVLAELEPDDTLKATVRGSVMIAAADLFFTTTRAASTSELINYTRNNLQADYKVAQAPTEVRLAGHSFVRFEYFSPIAGLHWRILATEVRCHVVQFIFTNRDTKVLDELTGEIASLKLPDEAGLSQGTGGRDVPVCVKDYASPENVVARVDPIFTDRKYNPVPVRVIIDKDGKVKHIHFLSAFPDQSQAITTALLQWRFKPYLRNGEAVEVETGILFGRGQPGAL